MRNIKLQDVDDIIKKNKKQANKALISPKRRKRSRPRSLGERQALDQIAIRRWEKAVETGKIKKVGERVLFYDYD